MLEKNYKRKKSKGRMDSRKNKETTARDEDDFLNVPL
jgi:hypothetical protein